MKTVSKLKTISYFMLRNSKIKQFTCSKTNHRKKQFLHLKSNILEKAKFNSNFIGSSFLN